MLNHLNNGTKNGIYINKKLQKKKENVTNKFDGL